MKWRKYGWMRVTLFFVVVSQISVFPDRYHWSIEQRWIEWKYNSTEKHDRVCSHRKLVFKRFFRRDTWRRDDWRRYVRDATDVWCLHEYFSALRFFPSVFFFLPAPSPAHRQPLFLCPRRSPRYPPPQASPFESNGQPWVPGRPVRDVASDSSAMTAINCSYFFLRRH